MVVVWWFVMMQVDCKGVCAGPGLRHDRNKYNMLLFTCRTPPMAPGA
jgi:hypothetical protein